MKFGAITLAILASLSASLAQAEDFKTINGKEYKNATVSRVEADGIVIKFHGGIATIFFVELPNEVQRRFGYDPDKIDAEKAAARAAKEKRIQEQKAAEQEREKRAQKAETTSPPEESSPAVTQEEPKASKQLDDAQFDDLRRRDWYEDLKAQEKLKNHADYMLSLMDSMEKRMFDCTECTPTYSQMLAAEHKAHRENYRALSAIAAKISATKSYDDYKKLKAIENQVLAAIETQKVEDGNDVAELRLRVNERDAELLENDQHYQ